MKAWLVLQEGPGAGHSYPLDPFKRPALSIGRSSECDVMLNDQRASRHHGDIRWNGRQWEVVDRGSTNGTYINDARMEKDQKGVLQLEDEIRFGDKSFYLKLSQ